jgi:hypothetical protein
VVLAEKNHSAFAEAGAKRVVFADINGEGIGEAAEESKKYAKHGEYRALAAKVDLTDTESVDKPRHDGGEGVWTYRLCRQ